MGGVVGRVMFDAPDGELVEPYLPLLAVREWLHVWKEAVMGLGKYQIELKFPSRLLEVGE
jgi:hypothetical protein